MSKKNAHQNTRLDEEKLAFLCSVAGAMKTDRSDVTRKMIDFLQRLGVEKAVDFLKNGGKSGPSSS
ncbi:hypothetical protein [Rhizobium sp. S163]|uniref:hypothetical protein n=1 Tax=Rhizobium sp. S163 TaxID=3055039 RepID=UPI0025A9C226|nr:hypothetical protein [Rhizobium sp. S163]MDM9647075.1 hypothetical protein [Rhizobium sp. S163]